MSNISGALAGSAMSYCGRPSMESSNPTHANTSMQGGQAVFENDNYRITADDNNTVTINNKHTGETYQAWGDPHLNVDGKHAFDFWGKTTFKLEDGTKVTIDTTPDKNNPGATLSSKVTITNGDYGAQITGIDSNKTGDLSVNETVGWGRVLDAVVSDGNTLHENPAGQGFLGVDRDGGIKAVDQNYINQTDLQKGGAALNDKYKEAFKQLTDLLSICFSGLLCEAGAQTDCEGGSQPIEHQIPRPPHCEPQPLSGTALTISITATFGHLFACQPPSPPPVCAPAPAPAPAPAEPPPAPVVDCPPAIPTPMESSGGGDGGGDGGCGGSGDGGGGSCGAD